MIHREIFEYISPARPPRPLSLARTCSASFTSTMIVSSLILEWIRIFLIYSNNIILLSGWRGHIGNPVSLVRSVSTATKQSDNVDFRSKFEATMLSRGIQYWLSHKNIFQNSFSSTRFNLACYVVFWCARKRISFECKLTNLISIVAWGGCLRGVFTFRFYDRTFD